MTPRDICQKAATIIEQRGHCKGKLWTHNPATGPVCALGAIRAALSPTGFVSDDMLHGPVARRYREVVNALDRVLWDDIAHWNDEPSTTAADVIAALRAVP